MWGLLVVSLGSSIVAPLIALTLVAPIGALTTDEKSFLAQIIGNWMCVAAILAIVAGAERLPLASIGIVAPRARDAWLGIAGYIVALIATAVVATNLIDIDRGPIDELFSLPAWVRISLFITAPTTEEILFRGYALTRLEMLTRRTWLAAVITCAFFVLLHAPFYGLKESLVRIPVTIVLTLLFLRTRSIWTPIATHLLFDIALLFA